MSDAWRPFEPCLENTLAAERWRRRDEPSTYFLRILESLRPHFEVEYPTLKNAHLVPSSVGSTP